MLDHITENVGQQVVNAAIEVHRTLGPGSLESAYDACLAYELIKRGFLVSRQRECPVINKGSRIDFAFRQDIIVNDCVIIELKALDRIIHEHLLKNGLERYMN